MTLSENSLTILGVFLLGLGLNLTPCVYPMLSVTLALFGVRQEANRGRSFLKALVYVLGMATMYSVLGTMAAFTGGFFGALLQNKIVLIAIALLLAGLALSMFGVYTFQLPSQLVNQFAGKRGTHLAGIYVSGLFVGIFAAPCIGPPILALLAFVGTKGDPLFGLWIFFILSLGLGAPYLILGTFSHLINRLPKSGVWLVWMERLFGIILLTLSAFYLILAVNAEFLKWLVPAALAGGGIFLGFIERSEKYSLGFVRFKQIAGAAAIAAALALPVFGPKETVKWEKYTPSALEEAVKTKRPVVLDFYADWCIPCHELDQFTYSDPKVIKGLDRFVRLKVDLTSPDDPETETIIEKFGIAGVPAILFLDAAGQEVKENRVTGFVDAKEFLGLLQSPQLQHESDPQSP